MDIVILNFEKLVINKQNSIDELINSIDKISVNDDDYFESNRLLENYSKLKYLKNIIINNYDFIKKPLTLFMNKIDEINQYYMNSVILDPAYYNNTESFKDTICIISNSLEGSLVTNHPMEKLDYVLSAYSNIIKIVNLEEVKIIDRDFERMFKRIKF